jgi:hypothetical protein
MPNPACQLDSECLGEPPNLAGNDPETNDDEAADPCGRACTDKGVSKAELVDRNAKPDHYKARKKGQGTDTIQ